AECIGENDSLTQASQMLRDLKVGALPICGEDNRLQGMLTDRDIVVACVADGGNPNNIRAGATVVKTPSPLVPMIPSMKQSRLCSTIRSVVYQSLMGIS